MKNNKAAKIILFSLVAFFVTYAIVLCTYNIKNSDNVLATIFSVFPVIMICFIVSLILILSATGGWGKFLKKHGKHRDAENYETMAKKSLADYNRVKYKYDKSVKNKSSDIEKELREREYFQKFNNREKIKLKNIFIGLTILLVCGIGYVPLFIFYNIHINKINGPNFVETTAVVTQVRIKGSDDDNPSYTLRYVYTDESGKNYIYDSNGSFSGVNFTLGKTTTIYYNKYNPEIAIGKSDGTMMFVGAMFFLLCGILVFILNLGIGANVIVPLIVGAIFTMFGSGFLMGIMQAGGYNLFEVLMSGPLAYGLSIFTVLGLMFGCSGLFGAGRELYYFTKYKISKRR